MPYSIDYNADAEAQAGGDLYHEPERPDRAPPQRRFVLPSIVKTTAAFLLGGAVLFGMEAEAPTQFRPSTLMGSYDARVEEQVKAAELRVQGRYEGWAAQVKASASESVEQYKAKAQTFLQAYQAGVDRAKLYADATTRLQLQVAGAEIDRKRAEQSGEIGLVSIGRMLGVGMNALEPGSGNDALKWSQDRSVELSEELRQAAESGVDVKVDGWNTNLPDTAALQSQLDGIKPMTVPPLPSLGPDASPNR